MCSFTSFLLRHFSFSIFSLCSIFLVSLTTSVFSHFFFPPFSFMSFSCISSSHPPSKLHLFFYLFSPRTSIFSPPPFHFVPPLFSSSFPFVPLFSNVPLMLFILCLLSSCLHSLSPFFPSMVESFIFFLMFSDLLLSFNSFYLFSL